MPDTFPKPWSAEWCGDCYRVFDANNRHLFIITSDELLNEDENPKDATVLGYGTDDEQRILCVSIEGLFPDA